MHAGNRCIRGFLALNLIRALDPDRERPAAELAPSTWLDREQTLRLAAAAHERACGGDWSRFHELCAGSVAHIVELGYRSVLRFREPSRTLGALSVLWRASFGFGRAIAHCDRRGATVHVIECASITELEGHIGVGWSLGVARQIGVDGARVELLRRPWAGEGDEQVMRLRWRDPNRRPTPVPSSTLRLARPKIPAAVG